MRYTKLSFDDLVKEFKDPDLGQHWKFFHLGEIGNILLEGGEEAKQAEDFFRDLLDSNNPDDKLVAFRHLVDLDYMKEETYKKLTEFKNDPSNEEIYIKAGKPVI